jgi:hypothetical protein
MFNIITYENPHRFFRSIDFKENELHIAGTSALTTYLKNRTREYKNRIWTYDIFKKSIYKEWYDPISILKMKICVRDLIDKRKSENYRNILKKDIDSITEAFRDLIEIGIEKLDDKSESDSYTIELIKLFNKFSEDQVAKSLNTFTRLRHDEMIKNLNDTTKKINGNTLVKNYIEKIDCIYLYNINYVNINRYVLFRRLLWKEIKLIFCIPIYNEYKAITEPWENIYREITEKEIDSSETMDGYKELSSCSYINYLKNGSRDKDNKKRIGMHEFSHPLEFKTYLKANKLLQESDKNKLEKYIENVDKFKIDVLSYYDNIPDKETFRYYKHVREYIAFDGNNTNQSFGYDVVGVKDKDHSIFDSSIGKFFKGIYTGSWDEEGKKFLISYENFCRCMISGMITFKESNRVISGKDAIGFLSDLRTYMDGIKSFTEIKDRLNSLELLQTFSNKFDEEAKSKAKNKTKKLLSNPFKFLSYADNSRYKITFKQFMKLVEKFEKIIEKLIPNYNLIDVENHIEMLREMILNNDLISEENKQKLEENLKVSIDERLQEIEIKEMGELIQILLSPITNKEIDEHDENRFKEFDQIEGIVVNGTQKIHLVDLSVKAYESFLSNRNIESKHFSFDYLKKEIEKVEDKLKKEVLSKGLEVARLSQKNLKKMPRYYISMMMAFFKGEINFSWIDGMETFDQETYFYRRLKELYAIFDFVEIEENEKEQFEDYKWSDEELNSDKFRKISPMAWLDLDVCPNKFYYSSIVESHSVYKNDFHQRLYFSNIGRLFESATSRYDVEKFLFPLFPQWNNTIKSNLIATSMKQDIDEGYNFEDVNFPKNYKNIQMLRSKYSEGNANKSFKKKQIEAEHLIKKLTGDIENFKISKNNCSMCPYEAICSKKGSDFNAR